MTTIFSWIGVTLCLLVTFVSAQAQIIPLNDTLKQAAVGSWEMERARWEKINAYEGRYAIETPGPLQTNVDTVETALGEMVYYTDFFQPNDAYAENVLYMVSYYDYPEGTVHSDSLDLIAEIFDVTQEEATSSMGGELLYASDVEQEGYPGRIWRIDYRNGQATVRTRAYLVGRRYYAVQIISKGALRLNSSSDRFMDSFRFFAPEG